MKLKPIYTKLFIRKLGPCGTKSNCVNERREYYDAVEQGVHVRPARSPAHLPDSYTDTKFIRRQKSWKHQNRTRKAWGRNLK